jgi:hypothetical protein
MILASMVFSWFGLALLYTFALGRAVSGVMPTPDSRIKMEASRFVSANLG